MSRKLGNLIKAGVFALPFAMPGVALAQSAGGASTQDPNSSRSDTIKLKTQQNSNGTTPGAENNTHSDRMNTGNAGGGLDKGKSDSSGRTAGSLGIDSGAGSSTGVPDTKGANERSTSGSGTNSDESSSANKPSSESETTTNIEEHRTTKRQHSHKNTASAKAFRDPSGTNNSDLKSGTSDTNRNTMSTPDKDFDKR
jgi:hypothetical protein